MKSNWNKIIFTVGFLRFSGLGSKCRRTNAVLFRHTTMWLEWTRILGGPCPQCHSNSFGWRPRLIKRKFILASWPCKKATIPMSNHSRNELFPITRAPAKNYRRLPKKEGLKFPGTNFMAQGMNEQWDTNSAGLENPAMEKQDMDSPPHLASLLVTNANNPMDNRQMAC